MNINLLVTHVVVPAKLQVCKFAGGGIIGRVAGLSLGGQIHSGADQCFQALDRIKEANRPTNGVAPFDYERAEGEDATEAVANEISMNLEALVGTTDEPAPKAVPNHPASDTTSKFANLQFGRNYDVSHK